MVTDPNQIFLSGLPRIHVFPQGPAWYICSPAVNTVKTECRNALGQPEDIELKIIVNYSHGGDPKTIALPKAFPPSTLR